MRMRPPLLGSQTAKVAHRRPELVAAEIDDPRLAPVHEPVSWLPVTMGRNEGHRLGRVRAEDGPNLFNGGPVYPVRGFQPRKCLGRGPCLIVDVDA